ncbi:YggS family pyridoxal phosphate-dependent enzyme [Parashewanella spongiae]|uniref:Pyridoxal phosphate homeostasis protein n=1 Tax=Parashewanella spongiae TaxID=342950 RepID=A0A3A6TLQ8_9GAMM|nr:YggS family pyridoxal phosphate-dependent enzyme [Parashewanella spongiae]MCL1078307.1 YggS family pyridoxal phosphate-dependent enzyme [Parashewanella spongiae]RJY15031.1 YggS family pyridoxal phosphate-dependent enzyme [Parashewanella spongiae]
MITITDRLAQTLDRIKLAIDKYHRVPDSVTLLAVSKTKPNSDIITAYDSGQRDFGENYIQEAIQKIQALSSSHNDIVWHFIGSLQSNKTADAATHFDWIHTIEREKIAVRLNNQRSDALPPLNICIQVNISQESSKSGVLLSDVDTLAELIHSLPRLALRGLMAIPSSIDDEQKLSIEFSSMQSAFKKLQARYPNVDTLSLGMSNDIELAVKHDSTMVRVGSAIFGKR